MKLKLYFILFVICNTSLFAQSFTLTVENGFGSGTYQEGVTVHIWSDTPTQNIVFTNWSGNATEFLKFSNEWHTILFIPENTNVGDLTLKANFNTIQAASIIGSKDFMLLGKNGSVVSNVSKKIFFGLPETPKGLVFLFHGTGGSGENLFNRFESYNLIKDLVYNNYAVFTLDANENTVGDQNGDSKLRWNNASISITGSNANIDLLNVNRLKDSIINTFSIDENIPTFSVGMSAGAVFSDICATVLQFNASAHITAKGITDLYKRADIAPIIWLMSANDTNESADNNSAFGNYETMKANQTAAWFLLDKTPLHSTRFQRSIHGITAEQSVAVFNTLLSNNYLDSQNILNVIDARTVSQNIFNGLNLSIAQRLEILEQLLYSNADHILHSEYNKQIIRFFNEQLSVLSIESLNDKKSKLAIYPNPVTDLVKLKLKQPYKNLKLTIYTLEGKCVLMQENTTEIQMQHFAKGIYIFKIQVDESVEVVRVVKE